MKGYFVSGTDTGVGKTVVCLAIALAMKITGHRVFVFKPIETACDPEPADATLYNRFLDLGGVEGICPFRFKLPLSPKIAARIENTNIDFQVIYDAYERLALNYDFVLIEGAGGLMVPIENNFMMADLIRAFGLPLILVAPNRLGVINHSILSIRASYDYGIDLRGLILNQISHLCDLSFDTNLQLIRDYFPFLFYSEFSYVLDFSTDVFISLGHKIVKDLNL